MRIALVEEDSREKTAVCGLLARYGEENGLSLRTDSFVGAIGFLSDYKLNPVYDAVFIDLNLSHVGGLEAAAFLREADADVPIVFLADTAEYAVRGYEVEALDYLLKPLGYHELSGSLNKILRRKQATAEKIMLKTQRGFCKIALSSVLYVEVHDHQTVYHTLREDIPVWETLSRQEKILPSNVFVRCNSCFVVNLDYVTRVDGGMIELQGRNGEKISVPISRSKKREFLRKLTARYGKRDAAACLDAETCK